MVSLVISRGDGLLGAELHLFPQLIGISMQDVVYEDLLLGNSTIVAASGIMGSRVPGQNHV